MTRQEPSKAGTATSWLTVDFLVNAIRHNQGCRRTRKLQVQQVNYETAEGAGA